MREDVAGSTGSGGAWADRRQFRECQCTHVRGMVITPSGGDPETVTAADLAGVGLDGTPQDGVTPSSEWAMHAAVYHECPDAAFIVHTHADACTALACLGPGCRRFITWSCSSAAMTCVARLM